jgi:hypothetical protein
MDTQPDLSSDQCRAPAVARRHVVAVVVVTLMLLLPLGNVAAAGTRACGAADSAQFGPDFVRLQAMLGDSMGVPTTCEQRTSDGDLVQTTSTGLAIYRAQARAALFASGAEHWALTDNGLITWTANWHQGFDPPIQAPAVENPVDSSPPQPGAALASVLALNMIGAGQGDPPSLLLEWRGIIYEVQTAAGCPDAPRAVGKPVFVRSLGALGSPGAELVLLPEHQTCAILAIQPQSRS